VKKEKIDIGIIGGSGFYTFPELEETQKMSLQTRYGSPSDEIIIGTYKGKRVAFIPRHGRKHVIPPHKIPYKANLSALKELGVKQILATAVSGSLRNDIRPGDFVILDQFVNFTWGRDNYFDVDNKFVHLPMAEPYCPRLRKRIYNEAQKLGIPVHKGGTAVIIQGPRFSTRGESSFFVKQGWDIVNMTQYPECYLAREMGLCYAAIAMVTDYEVGVKNTNLSMDKNNMSRILAIFNDNIVKVKKLITELISNLPIGGWCDCAQSQLKDYYKK
jgi:5'-methylthioadenosine phosphorylase